MFTLESNLLADASVHDCVVLDRIVDGKKYKIAYAVLNTLYPPARLYDLLGDGEDGESRAILIPVKYLPYTADGSPDELALQQVPLVDDAFLRGCEQHLLNIPEVTEAAAVSRYPEFHTRSNPITDWLPDWNTVEVSAGAAGQSPLKEQFWSEEIAESNGGKLEARPGAAENLQQLLLNAAQSDKGVQHVRADGSQYFQPYSELLNEARCITGALRAQGLQPQDKVLFQLGDSGSFLAAFWGCVLGGFVPVPVSLAPTYAQINSHVQKLFGAWNKLDKPLIVADTDLMPDLSRLPVLMGEPEVVLDVVDIQRLKQHAPAMDCHVSAGDDLALLLLTSGSTGLPKAVMQSHRSLLGMSAGTIQMNGFNADDVTLNWMPLEHVGAIVFLGIVAVDLQCTQIHVPTNLILKKPLVWLDLIQQHRGSISWAPNFAFSLLNDRSAVIEAGEWDLSSMRFLVNAGEQIVAKTVRRFLRLLQGHGLPEDALRPAFGMSETCSGISWSTGLTLENTDDDTVFVELGGPIPGASLRIANDQGEVQKEGVPGRFQVKGISVTSGYYNDPERNEEVFSDGGWFDTGDIGYLSGGKLVLTGRDKDDIIINGINIYSHEIESIIEELDGVETSFTGAAAIHISGDSSDHLAVFFVPVLHEKYFIQDLIKRIRKQVVQKAGVNPEYLIPLQKNAVPKTDIGKIQRSKLVTAFESGQYDDVLQQLGLQPEHNNNLPNWFYQRVWQARNVSVTPEIQDIQLSGSSLIFTDDAGLGESLIAQLSTDNGSVGIRVGAGSDFIRVDKNNYTLIPDSPEHYQRLFKCLADDGIRINRVLHLWSYTRETILPETAADLQQLMRRSVYSLLTLSEILSEHSAEQPLPFYVISNNAQVPDAAMDQDSIAVEKSLLPILLTTIAQETPLLSCRHINFVGEPEVEQHLAGLLKELTAQGAETEVAYRGEQRLVPRLALAATEGRQEPQTDLLESGGLYVITGGSGGLGLALAHDLQQRYQARILLLSRNQPEAEALKALGDNCLHDCVDVSDPLQVEQALRRAEVRWDCPTSGIFHLAGQFQPGALIPENRECFDSGLTAKVMGCLSIEQALQKRPKCLVVYYSSLNSFFAGVNVGSFAAASRFLEAFAHYQRAQAKRNVYCLHWSFWDEAGFNHDSDNKAAMQSQGYLPLSTSQGLASLQVALHYRLPSLYIGLQAGHPHIAPWVNEGDLATSEVVTYFSVANESAEPVAELPKELSLSDQFSIPVVCACLPLDDMPRTPEGHIDYARLQSGDVYGAPASLQPFSEIEQSIAEIWQDILGLPEVGSQDNFFELGGHSLLLTQMQNRLQETFDVELSIVDMFKYSTVAALAEFLEQPEDTVNQATQAGMRQAELRLQHRQSASNDVAVVGVACRFPGAENKDQFWDNLKHGVESISFFSEEEVLASGVAPELVKNPNYVKASPVLQDADCFDAEFFGYNAREAELMDPQQRVLLECAWESLEDAGYNPLNYAGSIGMYAGAAMNTYLLNNIMPSRHTLDSHDDLSVTTLDSMGGFQLMVDNDKDYLTTRVSYKLDLRGPSVNIQTACSTSLIAVHMAAQSLLAGECDMMLAGGVSIQAPQKIGHLYQEGMIVTPDGHCRAFDAEAEGTIFGSGAGLVVLKRLQDALDDGDNIYAVVKGSSSSNDGGEKVGYAAPSGDGQSIAAAEALAMAGFDADSLGYMEAHGTGTVMGDPIEVSGLGQALRSGTDKSSYCALGSVKTNIGHMQIASGIAGFIKTVLSIQNQQIPPSLHFNQANPAINFERSPFYVNTGLRDWQRTAGIPRRAGVNSLGIGGANAHVLLEENIHPQPDRGAEERSHHVLTLSARTPESLQRLAKRYEDFTRNKQSASLADICFTANTGREHFAHRLAIVADSVSELQDFLADGQADNASRVQAQVQANMKTAFLFTGQGSQYAGMGQDLYHSHSEFRGVLDQCATILESYLEVPLLSILFPEADDNADLIHQTAYTQPALFALEYALARLWLSWGIQPKAVMGHSLGEYVAACVAGVFSLEDALKLVAHRARLMQALPQDGAMVAVFATEATVLTALNEYSDKVSLAASNGPESMVISGQREAVAQVVLDFDQQGIRTKALQVSHAFHSPLMEAMLDDYAEVVAGVTLSAPEITLISNLTGQPIDDDILTVDYWLRHIRRGVRFAGSVQYLHQHDFNCFVEIGPGPVLSGMARQSVSDDNTLWLPSLRKGNPDWAVILQSLGTLHVNGVTVDWSAFDAVYSRYRCSLPTYAFERKRYWVEPPQRGVNTQRTRLHPLIDKKIQSPLVAGSLFETFFHTASLPFLQDHLIYDRVVASGACHVSLIMGAAEQVFASQGCVLEAIFFPQALVVPEQGCNVQLMVTPLAEDQTAEFKLVSFMPDAPEQWETHATGSMRRGVSPPSVDVDSNRFNTLWESLDTHITSDAFYKIQSDRHIHLGPTYQWMEGIRRGDKEALCRIRLAPAVHDATKYQMPPGLIDSSFGLLVSSVDMPVEETFVPFSIERIEFYRPLSHYRLWGHAVVRPESDADRLVGDITLYDCETGVAVAAFVGLEGRKADASIIKSSLGFDYSDWFYNTRWQQQAARIADDSISGHWLVLADDQESGSAIADGLQAKGASCRLVQIADINVLNPGDLYSLLEEEEDKQALAGTVLSLTSVATDDDPASDACITLLHLAQSLIQHDYNKPCYILTRGAQDFADAPVYPVARALSGMCKVLRMEHPEIPFITIDVDHRISQQQAGLHLLTEIAGSDGEDETLWYQGQRYVGRWARSRINHNEAPPVHAEASYLISGGTGALGLLIAEWLVEQGAQHLVLLSRNGLRSADAEARVQQLQDNGVEVHLPQLDISDSEQLETVLKAMNLPEVRGIFHAAGVLDDGLIISQNRQRFNKVWEPKATGAWNLHQYSRDKTLDYFVLFSSAAALLGNQGQSNYSAANAYLDGLAHLRHQQDLPALSINWGPWEQAGMAVATRSDQLARQGLKAISPDEGISILQHLSGGNVAQVGAMSCDWAVYTRQFEQPRSFFHNFNSLAPQDEQPKQSSDGVMARIGVAAPGEQQLAVLLDYISQVACGVLGLSGNNELDKDKPLMEQGLDSLQAVEMRNRLGKEIDVSLPVSLLFNYPSVNALSDYMAGALGLTTELNADEELADPEADFDFIDDLDDDELEALINMELNE